MLDLMNSSLHSQRSRCLLSVSDRGPNPSLFDVNRTVAFSRACIYLVSVVQPTSLASLLWSRTGEESGCEVSSPNLCEI